MRETLRKHKNTLLLLYVIGVISMMGFLACKLILPSTRGQNNTIFKSRPVYDPNTCTQVFLEGALHYFADQYGSDYDDMHATVTRENLHWRVDASNEQGDAHYLCQITPGTWTDFTYAMQRSDLEYSNPVDQLEVMAWAFANGLQHRWTTWKRMHGITTELSRTKSYDLGPAFIFPI